MNAWWAAETRMSLVAVARDAGRDKETIRRWCTRGLKLCPRGPIIKLESYRIGAERFTTREAYDRFVLRRTEKP